MSIKARLDRLTRRLPSPPLPPIVIRRVIVNPDGTVHRILQRVGRELVEVAPDA